MHPQIQKRMIFDVSYQRPGGRDARGGLLYPDIIHTKAYVAQKVTTVRNFAGEEVTSNTQVYLLGYLKFPKGTKFSVMGEESLLMLACQPFPGLPGTSGTTVVYL